MRISPKKPIVVVGFPGITDKAIDTVGLPNLRNPVTLCPLIFVSKFVNELFVISDNLSNGYGYVRGLGVLFHFTYLTSKFH